MHWTPSLWPIFVVFLNNNNQKLGMWSSILVIHLGNFLTVPLRNYSDQRMAPGIIPIRSYVPMIMMMSQASVWPIYYRYRPIYRYRGLYRYRPINFSISVAYRSRIWNGGAENNFKNVPHYNKNAQNYFNSKRKRAISHKY